MPSTHVVQRLTRALVAWSFLAQASPADDGQVHLLVPTSKSMAATPAGCLDSPVTAAWKSRPLQVVRAQPFRQPSQPATLFVVASLLQTGETEQQEIASEVVSGLSGLSNVQIEFFIEGSPSPSRFESIDLGPSNPRIAVWKSEGPPADENSVAHLLWRMHRLGRVRFVESRRILEELSRWAVQANGPVPVFWVAQRFSWFDDRLRRSYFKDIILPPLLRYGPFAEWNRYGTISKSGMAIFPILVSPDPRLERVQIAASEYMAEIFGSKQSRGTGTGDALRSAIAVAQSSYWVTVQEGAKETRAAEDRATASPVTVASRSGDCNLNWSRQLALSNLRQDDLDRNQRLTELLFPDGIRVQVNQGCPSPLDDSGRRQVSLGLPSQVTNRPGSLQLYVESRNARGDTVKQRATVSKQRPCLSIAHSGTLQYTLFVFDPETTWVGAARGTITQ